MKNPSATDHGTVSHIKPREDRGTPASAFAMAVLLGGVVLMVAGFVLFPAGGAHSLWAPGVYLVAAGVAGVALKRGYPHRALGWCNLVTLGRLAIVALLFGAMIAQAPPSWALFTVAALALALDGVDGWLARAQGLASRFGARFDVEVDAVFALVLALSAANSGAAHPLVILLGLPHYLFKTAQIAFPWLKGALPDSFARKAVCVFQIGALVALQLPNLPQGALDPVIIAVVLALGWSFGRDILGLWRTRS